MPRPEIGSRVLLIYRECECTASCATPPGVVAPRCNECGGLFLPLGGNPPHGALDEEFEKWAANRREVGIAFRAVAENEAEAFGS